MIVVVNDANILIDLIKLQLVEAFFNITWEFHSTNLIIENELYDEQKEQLQPYINSGKLIIQELDVEDMFSIMSIQAQKPQLSDKDCSALHCAKKLNASLVTSDNTLRKFAKTQKVDVHGHLWVFDALLQHNCITPQTAIDKLTELNTINSKLNLPENHCKARIEIWKQL
ncbi:MAG: putative nucleic acid-binding protein [Patiriisocius sp.]|jgi:predicted nucleic acid-binding protein